MAGFDYCHWAGERCVYANYQENPSSRGRCEFHEAFVQGDALGMFAGLRNEHGWPNGVTLESAEQAPDGSWRLMLIARPDK